MAGLALAFGIIGAFAVGQAAPSEEDLVLLQPYLDRTPLGTGIEAYDSDGVILVPLGEICRLLAFGITVNASRDAAEGFFIDSGRTFRLILGRDAVEVEGRRVPMPRALAMPRDLYVDARSLPTFFPMGVQVDLKGSSLVLTPREKLPIQGIWELERQYGHESMSQYGDEAGAQGRPHVTPYSALRLPMADFALGVDQTTHPTDAQVEGSLELGGDLLWMSADIFASRANGSWSDSRATLFRENPGGGLLGPLKARRVELGDLFTSPTMDLVGALPQGRGVSIDNNPIAYRTRFASRTFRGALAEGWSVELFQNNGLVAFQPSGRDNLYEFKDVPLRFGINLFRLVFHGPLGERREQNYRLDIAQGQPAPGACFYSLAGVEPRSGPFDPSQPQGVATADPGNPAYQAHMDFGLSSAFSVQAGVSGMPLQDGYHTYDMVGARAFWSFLALQTSLAQDWGPGGKRGAAAEWSLSTGNQYSSLTLRRDQFWQGFQRSSFDTTVLGATGFTVKSATGVNLNLNGTVAGFPLSWSAQVDAEDYVGGARGYRDRLLVTTQIRGISLSNSISRLSLPGQGNPMEGTVSVSAFKQAWSWQGNLTYDQFGVNGWGAQVQDFHPKGYQYSFGMNGAIGSTSAANAQGPTLVHAGIQRLVGRWGFGFNAAKTGPAYSGNLRLQVSLGREPRSGKWATDAQPLATSGAVSAIAYQDTNGNGFRDAGEPTLPGAKFKVGGGQAVNQLQDPDITFVTRLAPAQPVDVSLDVTSLEDPAQQPAVKAYMILPRAGFVERLEFPVFLSGSLNGTTRIQRGGKRLEFPGLELEVLDASGKRVRVMRSAYDGFFECTDLPYGDYLLRVTPDEVVRVGLEPAERRIRIEANRPFLDGVDLVVAPRVEESKPIPERSQP